MDKQMLKIILSAIENNTKVIIYLLDVDLEACFRDSGMMFKPDKTCICGDGSDCRQKKICEIYSAMQEQLEVIDTAIFAVTA